MAEDSFLLVNLGQENSKKLAEVISNDTCRKILNALSAKEHTETELSKALNLPISTIHYNLKNLVSAKIVLADEYHYSSRGKEVLHYRLARKLIIIAPAETDATKTADILKKYLPLSAVVIAAGIVIDLLSRTESNALQATAMSADAAPMAFAKAAPASAELAQEGAQLLSASAPSTGAIVQEPSLAAVFVTGAMCAFALMLAFELIAKYLRARKNKKKEN